MQLPAKKRMSGAAVRKERATRTPARQAAVDARKASGAAKRAEKAALERARQKRLRDAAAAAPIAAQSGDNLVPPVSRFGYLPREFVASEQWHVAVMAAAGFPVESIAIQLQIPEDTLKLRFAGSLERGLAMSTALVAETLFRKALGDGPQAVTAAIFWLKARAGWRDVQVIENNFNVKLAPDERTQLIDRMKDMVARIPPARQAELEREPQH